MLLLKSVRNKNRPKKTAQWFYTVDPLADNYFGVSPYVYCANNPLIFVDPDGRAYKLVYGENGQVVNYYRVCDDEAYEMDGEGNYTNLKEGYSDFPVVSTAPISNDGNFQDQGGSLGTNLGYVNDVLSSAGTAAGGAELFTQANASSRITYIKINGASSWVSSSKVVSTFKAVGTYTVVGGVVIDLTLGATGYQTSGKTAANIGVGIGAWAIGGVPGIVVGVGYLILDKTGCLDGPPGIINHTPPSIAVPDNTRVTPPLLKFPVN